MHLALALRTLRVEEARWRAVTLLVGIAWMGSAPLSLLPGGLVERTGRLLAQWSGPVSQPRAPGR